MSDLTPVMIEKCSIDDCWNARLARGWCSKHYNRWRRQGDPLVQSKWRKWTVSDRISGKWNVTDSGCWEWTAARQPSGYGVLRVLGKTVRAHRYVYESTFGPIEEGLELDHLCRNPPCVNPDHLEPVTHEENMRRGAAYWDRPKPSIDASTCPNGHEMTSGNTYVKPSGGARCKECGRDAWRRWNERRKLEEVARGRAPYAGRN